LAACTGSNGKNDVAQPMLKTQKGGARNKKCATQGATGEKLSEKGRAVLKPTKPGWIDLQGAKRE